MRISEEKDVKEEKSKNMNVYGLAKVNGYYFFITNNYKVFTVFLSLAMI